jgi:hypothetical protein
MQCVGAPNGKPHLILTCGTIVDADMRVASFRQWVDVRDMQFFPAPTLAKINEAGHQKARTHGHWAHLTSEGGDLSHIFATHKSNFRSKGYAPAQGVHLIGRRGDAVEPTRDTDSVTKCSTRPECGRQFTQRF